MGKVCETLYLDADNKKSGDYYGNLHLGHEAALRIYLDKNKDAAYTRFQKASDRTYEDLLGLADNISSPEDGDDSYTFTENNQKVKGLRATSFTDKYKDRYQEDEKLTEKIIYLKAVEILKNSKTPEDYGYTLNEVNYLSVDKTNVRLDKNKKEYKALIDEATLWTEDGKGTEFVKKLTREKKLNEFKTEAGTEIHRILDIYNKNYSNLLPTGEQGEYTPQDYRLAIEQTLDPDGKFPDKSIRMTGETKAVEYKNYEKLLEDFGGFLKSKFPKPNEVKILPEYKLFSTRRKLGGTTDLVIIDKDNNAHIFDIKTKEAKRRFLFNYEGKKMSGPLSNLWDNAYNNAALQLGLYEVALRDMGYNVKSRTVLYIEGEVTQKANSINKFRYDKLQFDWDNSENRNKQSMAISIPSMRTEITKVFAAAGVEGLSAVKAKEHGKTNNIDEAISDLIGEDLDSGLTEERINRRAANELDRRSNRIDEATGKAFYFDKLGGGSGSRKFYDSKNLADQRKELIAYYRREEKATEELSNKFLIFANSQAGEFETSNSTKNIQARDLVKGLLPENYDFIKLKEIPGFDDYSSNIIVAVHKLTRTARIINLNQFNQDELLAVDYKTTGRRNIFGKYINDFTFNKIANKENKTNNIGSLSLTKTNLQLLRGAAIGLELHKVGYISSLENVVSGVINGGNDTAPVSLGANRLFPHLKVLKQILAEKGVGSKYFMDSLDSKILIDPKLMNPDPVDYLINLVDSGHKFVSKNEDVTNLYNLALQYKENNNSYREEMLDSLVATYNKLDDLLKNKTHDNPQAMKEDPEYVLLSKLILQFQDINIQIGDFDPKLEIDAAARIGSNFRDSAISELDRKIKSSGIKISNYLSEWSNKKDRLLDALMKDKSILAKVGTNDITDIFKPLWEIDPETRSKDVDEANPDKLYVLKDTKDPKNNLTDAQKDFINFFNESIFNGLGMSLTAAQFKDIMEGKTWKKGAVPLVPASMINKISKAEGKEQGKLYLASLFKTTINMVKERRSVHTKLGNSFLKQAGEGSLQHGKERRSMLGIDADGQYLGSGIDLETNLETVLQMFVVKSVTNYYHSRTEATKNALSCIAFIDQVQHFNDTSQVRDYMDKVVKLRVYNERNDEGTTAKVLDGTKKVMSGLTFALSLKTIVMEGATNMFTSVSNNIVQTLTKKEDRRYSGVSFTKAATFTSLGGTAGAVLKRKQLSHAISKSFGLYNADPESFTKKDKSMTRKNGFFQSRWLYSLNNIPFKFFKTTSFVAELYEQGIMESLSVDVDGNLKYDQTKDKRFSGIFDGTGNLKTVLSTDELRQKASLYTAILNDAYKDGTVDENGRLTKPLSEKQLIDMQHYALESFGSIDNDAKSTMALTAVGRMFLGYRTWFLSKKDRYWTTSGLSKVQGGYQFVADEDHPHGGEHSFEYEHVEGILQTLHHIAKSTMQIAKSKSFKDAGYQNLNKRQKQNLIKFGSDLATFNIIIAMIMAAIDDDDDFKKGPGKIYSDVLLNSVGDLNMFLTMDSMLTGGPLPVINTMIRSSSALVDAFTYSVSGTVQKGSNPLSKITGFQRSFDWSE